WLVAVVAVGAGIIWHQADPARRRELGEDARAPWLATLLSGNDRRVLALRFGGGGVLVLIGVIGIAVAAVPVQGGLSVLLTGLLFALLAVSGDTVVVGDCPVDERIAALVAAAREAMVNAGKHAKVQTVSLYAEVEDEQVSVFVRDRGVGFDPAAVDDDRHGVRGSIVGRMT